MTPIEKYRNTIRQRLNNQTDTLLVVTGPCSIYNEEESILFAEKLALLQKELGSCIFLVMRAFVEKSRTAHSWRGFVYKRETDNNEDILKGIKRTKSLFSKLNVPLAMEFIDPAIFLHLKDYVSWGFIGARTCSSTTHRVMASDANFPVGFKNTLDGDILSAANACLVASHPHCILTNDEQRTTPGNPYTHIVLRGGKNGTNFDKESVDFSLAFQKKRDIHTPIMIDCSHGNCPNKPDDQKEAFLEGLKGYLENPGNVLGMMLESNLLKGSSKKSKIPGVSFTDPCLSFEETRELLLLAKEKITARHHKEGSTLPTSYVCSH